MIPDVSELLLGKNEGTVCETYIFEPSLEERALGHLLAVAELKDPTESGRALLEKVMSAIQREYYRGAQRGMLASFESALQQANLVLHEVSSQGYREWMQSFHVAVGVLGEAALHLSVAGEAMVLLYRKNKITNISYGLSQVPITNPLRAFSQVASGTVQTGDVLFWGTARVDQVIPESDLRLASYDHSAEEIAQSLEQSYRERAKQAPVGVLVAMVTEEKMPSESHKKLGFSPPRAAIGQQPHLPQPRQPLLKKRSRGEYLLTLLWQLTKFSINSLKLGLRQAGALVIAASKKWRNRVRREIAPTEPGRATKAAGVMEKLKAIRTPLLPSLGSFPRRLWGSWRQWLAAMPITSKLFIALALVLAIALLVSLSLLSRKRTEDTSIQRASELLHEGQTKEQAAATALIYNNREQAQNLLREAQGLAEELAATGLYGEEVRQLQSDIQAQSDRIQRIVRVNAEAAPVGDFSSVLDDGSVGGLFWLEDQLYAYHAASNRIFKMTEKGEVQAFVNNSQGVGFFVKGIDHQADKQILFLTDEPGIAVVDTKTGTVSSQELALPAAETGVVALVPYGSRLYLYDATTHNIYAYSKSLRGYTGREAWVKEQSQLPREVTGLAIDGFIYTLHNDGTIKRFFKGEVQPEFTVETVSPVLKGPSKLKTEADWRNLYVLDKNENRVVIFDKKGQLQRQITIDRKWPLTDIAVAGKEQALFLLSGNTVFKASLLE
jgi:hypothetical protein